ncbi:tetratricopeptide repeat protein [bacterium]|nr:tetratricopeptide repeat protein [bacterium]
MKHRSKSRSGIDPGIPAPDPSVNIQHGKKTLFTVLTVLIPVIFLLLIEIVLRLAHYGGDQRLFVSAPREVSKYMMLNNKVGSRYFFMQKTLPTPPKDLFLKNKPANGYRLFVLGGSTTAGFPYEGNIMFSRILQHRLAEAFPDRTVEVVNTAMSAVCSYTFLDFMDEILKQKPDGILFYAGHNEFYGALGVASTESLGKFPGFVKTYLGLRRFRIFLLMRDLTGRIRLLFNKSLSRRLKEDPTATLMERIVSDQAIPLNSRMYELGRKQFTLNLRGILSKAGKAGVPVMLSELVSNVKDQAPFISQKSDTLPPAADVFTQARAEESAGRFRHAGSLYRRAKDLDALRFRATEEFNRIIHEAAVSFSLPVVGMKQVFEQASLNGLIGDSLMTDHLHPNIRGYFYMADAFFNTMRENGWMSRNWASGPVHSDDVFIRSWGITRMDSVYADLAISYLKGSWPFKPRSEVNRALEKFERKNLLDSLALRAIVDSSFGLELAHLALAEHYEKTRQWDQALREYKALYTTIPFEVMFYNRSARILIGLNRQEEALPLLLKSIEVGDTEFAYKWAGQIETANKDYAQAVGHLQRAVRMNPTDPQTYYHLSIALALSGQTGKAEDIFKMMKTRFPNSEYLFVLQKTFGKPESTEEAEWKRIMARAKACLDRNENDEALSLLRRSLEIRESGTAHHWMGMALLKRRDTAGAIASFGRARKFLPRDGNILYYLAAAHAMERKYEKASAILDTLYAEHPGFGDPSNLKGQLARKLGR